MTIPQATMREIARRYGWEPGKTVPCPCSYCGKPGEVSGWIGTRGKPTLCVNFSHEIDHVHPWADGGSNDADNLVPCCRTCNRKKMAGPASRINREP